MRVAAGALRVEELAGGEAVVVDEDGALGEGIGDACYQRLGAPVDLGQVALDGGSGPQLLELGRAGRRTVGPGEAGVLDGHAAPQPGGAAADVQRAGQGVADLEQQDDAAEVLGERGDPGALLEQALVLEAGALRLLQRGTGLEQLAGGAQVLGAQLAQDVAYEAAAAAAELQDGAARGQGGGDPARDAAPEQVAGLGRGDEVAAGPERLAAAGVIAQARRGQRQFHEVLEAEPAARGGGALRDQLGERAAHRGGGGQARSWAASQSRPGWPGADSCGPCLA